MRKVLGAQPGGEMSWLRTSKSKKKGGKMFSAEGVQRNCVLQTLVKRSSMKLQVDVPRLCSLNSESMQTLQNLITQSKNNKQNVV